MRRYENITVQERYDGKRVYRTTIYPPVPVSEMDLQIVTNEGDYLDTLALKYYGDPTLYWIIANVNNIGKGRMSVEPGLTLRIPMDVSNVISQYKKENLT
jgi:nucleoid-associated protein YgaU